MHEQRLHDLRRFYSILDRLEESNGGARKFGACSGRMDWPERGVYFIRECGEECADSRSGPRIVRVGTHALKAGSGTRLWTRLSQHRGQSSTGGGNHRGSIFRLLVGTALIRRNGLAFPTWGDGSSAAAEIRRGEVALETKVSAVIREMSLLWLAIEDEPGDQSLRGYIERNAIALLSNYGKPPLDPPCLSNKTNERSCTRERWSAQITA